MKPWTSRPVVGMTLACLLQAAVAAGVPEVVAVDVSAHRPACGVAVRQEGTKLHVRWPIATGEHGVLVLQLQPDRPLLEELGIARTADGPSTALLRKVNPVTFLTVGIRDLTAQGWNVFFDNPPRRPHETFRAVLGLKKACVESHGRRASVILDGLSAGPFRGDLRFTVYPGCALVHAEAVVATTKNACAILYDAGLVSPEPSWKAVTWLDTADQWRRVEATAKDPAAPVAVRHRTILAESDGGAVAVFPPPHQYLYPLDFSNNFGLVWHGQDFHKDPSLARRANKGDGWGFGVRQPPEGDRRFVPWINAPPGTRQRLGVFYLLSSGPENRRRESPGGKAMEQVRRFTHGDRFTRLDGYLTFTSHYHVEHTLDFLRRQREQKTDGIPRGLEEPPFVKTFKARGIDIVHLAEFHVSHTPKMNAERLSLLKTLHGECRRLSGKDFLLLPGEEPNVHLGGHWISLFPRPVYWHLHPGPGIPFERKVPGLGTVYAVHDAADVLRLMEKEQGLMWTAHPRTKSSYGFPDRYRTKDFYLSDRFLGAAWKAMPADLSQPRLGTRALDLLDDMANWGQRKYVLGEVDVFRVEPEHELYGHMNVNYLKLDRLPRFDDGWQPVLDALRGGRFFVSTGEVLLPEFTVGGKGSGQVLRLGGKTTAELEARLEWTFPPAFAEIIWGDGSRVHRRRIDLADGEAFSGRRLRALVDLKGARWVRLEAWDVAANGAFSQPVWIE
jgi:hypothetical protein